MSYYEILVRMCLIHTSDCNLLLVYNDGIIKISIDANNR